MRRLIHEFQRMEINILQFMNIMIIMIQVGDFLHGSSTTEIVSRLKILLKRQIIVCVVIIIIIIVHFANVLYAAKNDGLDTSADYTQTKYHYSNNF